MHHNDGGSSNDIMEHQIPLQDLLKAADADVELHRSRVRAVQENNVGLLSILMSNQ